MNTIRIPLNSNRIQKLQEYHNWIEKKSIDLNLTDYWEIHSNKIALKFNADSVTLTGESGFYFPQPSNSYRRLRHFTAQMPINLSYWIFIFFRKLFNRHYDFLASYPRAYDLIFRSDPVLGRKSELQLYNSALDFKTFQGMKKKWPDSKTHILTDATIKSYFYLQLIEDKMPGLKNATVCEIGPGTGNMAQLFYHHFNNKLFLVDLPRTFFFSFTFLAQSYPTARIALPNEVADKNFDPQNYDIIMLTPQQTSHIKNQSVDLTVNVHSMQEMNNEAIYSYFDLVDRISKPGGIFFCANRMEKIMDGKPIRFLDYPWRSNTRTIIFEPDPLIRLVNLSPSYIRVEQYT